MKQIITKEDLPNIIGKFIVQLNDYQTSPDMTESFIKNSGFWLEKRISFIGTLYGASGSPYVSTKKGALIIINGMYYTHGVHSEEEFVEYFNNYLKGHEGERYHRLLTAKELDWLTGELKK